MEKWKKIIEYQQERLDIKFEKKKNKKKLRYLACEDTKNKSWFFVDTENGATLTLPFGTITTDVLNVLITTSPTNPYYTDSYTNGINAGIDREVLEELAENIKYNEKYIVKLLDFINDLAELKKTLTEAQYKMLANEIWLTYRDIDNPELFREYTELIEAGYSSEAKDYLQSLNRVKETISCIYCDTLFFMNENNDPVVGRVFALQDSDYISGIFRWDLFHLLQGTAETPHICAKCGKLYQANKNTSKYCEDCGKNKKNIRLENRKNNICRYRHKQILDKLNIYKGAAVYKEDFKKESNYYWAIVSNKEPKEVPRTFDSTIKTEKQYLEWLETIFKKPVETLRDRYQ